MVKFSSQLATPTNNFLGRTERLRQQQEERDKKIAEQRRIDELKAKINIAGENLYSDTETNPLTVKEYVRRYNSIDPEIKNLYMSPEEFSSKYGLQLGEREAQFNEKKKYEYELKEWEEAKYFSRHKIYYSNMPKGVREKWEMIEQFDLETQNLKEKIAERQQAERQYLPSVDFEFKATAEEVSKKIETDPYLKEKYLGRNIGYFYENPEQKLNIEKQREQQARSFILEGKYGGVTLKESGSIKNILSTFNISNKKDNYISFYGGKPFSQSKTMAVEVGTGRIATENKLNTQNANLEDHYFIKDNSGRWIDTGVFNRKKVNMLSSETTGYLSPEKLNVYIDRSPDILKYAVYEQGLTMLKPEKKLSFYGETQQTFKEKGTLGGVLFLKDTAVNKTAFGLTELMQRQMKTLSPKSLRPYVDALYKSNIKGITLSGINKFVVGSSLYINPYTRIPLMATELGYTFGTKPGKKEMWEEGKAIDKFLKTDLPVGEIAVVSLRLAELGIFIYDINKAYNIYSQKRLLKETSYTFAKPLKIDNKNYIYQVSEKSIAPVGFAYKPVKFIGNDNISSRQTTQALLKLKRLGNLNEYIYTGKAESSISYMGLSGKTKILTSGMQDVKGRIRLFNEGKLFANQEFLIPYGKLRETELPKSFINHMKRKFNVDVIGAYSREGAIIGTNPKINNIKEIEKILLHEKGHAIFNLNKDSFIKGLTGKEYTKFYNNAYDYVFEKYGEIPKVYKGFRGGKIPRVIDEYIADLYKGEEFFTKVKLYKKIKPVFYGETFLESGKSEVFGGYGKGFSKEGNFQVVSFPVSKATRSTDLMKNIRRLYFNKKDYGLILKPSYFKEERIIDFGESIKTIIDFGESIKFPSMNKKAQLSLSGFEPQVFPQQILPPSPSVTKVLDNAIIQSINRLLYKPETYRNVPFFDTSFLNKQQPKTRINQVNINKVESKLLDKVLIKNILNQGQGNKPAFKFAQPSLSSQRQIYKIPQIIKPELNYLNPPYIPIPAYPRPNKPVIPPLLFNFEGTIKKSNRTKDLNKMITELAYSQDFTAKALGLKPIKAKGKFDIEKQVRKIMTGLEIRGGII